MKRTLDSAHLGFGFRDLGFRVYGLGGLVLQGLEGLNIKRVHV